MRDNSINLLQYSLKRGIGGLTVYLKSPIFNEYFSKFGVNNEHQYEWSGNQQYRTQDLYINQPEFMSVTQSWRAGLFDNESNRYPNLSFLTAVDLDKGVRFRLKQPYSEKELTRFDKMFGVYASDFYNQYIKAQEIVKEIKKKYNKTKIKKGIKTIEKNTSDHLILDYDGNRIRFADSNTQTQNNEIEQWIRDAQTETTREPEQFINYNLLDGRQVSVTPDQYDRLNNAQSDINTSRHEMDAMLDENADSITIQLQQREIDNRQRVYDILLEELGIRA